MADPLLAFVVTASVICGIILVSLYYLRRKRTSSTTTSALPVHTHGLPDTIQAPGANSADGVKTACLMCLSRPKNGRHDFCGEACKEIAMKTTPLLLEVPKTHITFELVARKFKEAWNHPQKQACPPVKRVYRIVESAASLTRYTNYKNKHGNEGFRYHGTRRECRLGDAGNQYPCWSNTCPACCILRTSFKVSVANAGGAFGKGVYTSSASNKSANYAPNGVMFLTKVTLGKVRYVNRFAEVKQCPSGFDSVVFDRMSGRLNETVVYSDDAIRPLFLIVFG